MILLEEIDRSWSGAYTCIFNRDFSEILLLWRNKERREKIIAGWGNVGGTIEPGETPLQTCIREAREEIGVSLKPEDLAFICIKITPKSGPRRWAIHFYSTSIDENTKINLNKESRGYAWFGRKDLPKKTLDTKADILNWWTIAKKSRLT